MTLCLHSNLGTWVHQQRTYYKKYVNGEKSPFTEKKVHVLEQIGFSWQAYRKKRKLPSVETSTNTVETSSKSTKSKKQHKAIACDIKTPKKNDKKLSTESTKSPQTSTTATKKREGKKMENNESGVKGNDKDAHAQDEGDKKLSADSTQALSTSKKTNKAKKAKSDISNTNGDYEQVPDKGDIMNTWICAACGEADCLIDRDADLLICEGTCGRAFHMPCANVKTPPLKEEKWICQDCTTGRQQCVVCHEFGQDGVDVFNCGKKGCGLFYHEHCLSTYDVDVKVVSTVESVDENGNVIDHSEGYDSLKDGDEAVVRTRPKFTCPAHQCWTCSGGIPPDDVPPESVEASDVQCTVVPDTETISNKGRGKGKRRKSKGKVNHPLSNSFQSKNETLFVSDFISIFVQIAPTHFQLYCIPLTTMTSY